MAGRGGAMSNMDFQRCNQCNEVLDMTCSCSPDNYIVQLPVSDHVSKSELRAWCEDEINLPAFTNESILTRILEKFCAGER